MQLLRDQPRVERAIVLLAAGHRHRIVEQNFVSGVNLGRHRRADCQQARVKVSAVTQIDEHVFLVGEMRRAGPGDALGPHVGEGRGFAIHPLRHVVAADAGQRA